MKRILQYLTFGILATCLQAAEALSADQSANPPYSDLGRSEIQELPDIDLSTLPEPQREDEESYLTKEEIKGPRLSLTIVCVGYRPAPIIYYDKAGMPRETYRNPLEYAPSQFMVKTKSNKMIEVISQQNQISAASIIPKNAEIPLYYVLPEGGGEDMKDRRKFVGMINPTPGMTHALVIVTKSPTAKLWTSPELKVVDISPNVFPEGSTLIINTASSDARYIRAGSKPVIVSGGQISLKKANPEVKSNRAPLFKLDYKINNYWFQWYMTRTRLYKGQRLILLSWTVPREEHPTKAKFTHFKHVADPLPVPTIKRVGLK